MLQTKHFTMLSHKIHWKHPSELCWTNISVSGTLSKSCLINAEIPRSYKTACLFWTLVSAMWRECTAPTKKNNTDYGLDDQRIWARFSRGTKVFPSLPLTNLLLWYPAKLPTQWVPGFISPWGKSAVAWHQHPPSSRKSMEHSFLTKLTLPHTASKLPTYYYRFHNCPLLVLILSHLN
jgi:hypothetical protein